VSQFVFDEQSLITPEAMAHAVVSAGAVARRDELEQGKAELALILSIAQQQLAAGNASEAIIKRTNIDLHKVRSKVAPEVWHQLVPIVHRHPATKLFHEDPFTRWSFEKPRGYSGDAHLLDFIYRHPSVTQELANASPLGKSLYEITSDSHSSNAVRERRDLLTMHVDAMADRRGGNLEVLAIAAGHLREASQSIALHEGRIQRWVALDQDPNSVKSIAREYEGTCIQATEGSVRSLLMSGDKLGKFDFIYAAGLYDYLSRKVAVKLTQKCLQMLKPRGVFLFANFSTEMIDDGFMETFMNWALLQRSEDDMWDIINGSVDRNAIDADVYFGANQNIVYATLKKRRETQAAVIARLLVPGDRFEIVMEPSDTWLIWDNLTDLPAEDDETELYGLSHAQAEMHCRRLNTTFQQSMLS
jgi:SAM-dependent methyltransferase